MANITVSYIFPGSEVIDSVLQELDNSELEGSDDEEGGLASSTSNSDCGPTRQIGFFEYATFFCPIFDKFMDPNEGNNDEIESSC